MTGAFEEVDTDMKIDELRDSGMTQEEARAMAQRQLGNVTRISEESRGTWIARWATDLIQDLRYAAR